MKREYLIKIEITDTKDLKWVDKSEWWTKTTNKSTLFLNSSKDQKLIKFQKIVLNVAQDLASVKMLKNKHFKNLKFYRFSCII